MRRTHNPSTTLVAATAALATVSRVVVAAEPCRDRRTWPFAAHSIWNTPIGSDAIYARANIFSPPAHPLEGFRVDTDHFIATSTDDPLTIFIDQGWWGANDTRWGGKCGRDHCCLEGNRSGVIPFPKERLVAPAGSRLQGDNNAAGVLLPDNETLVQFQPLYRCTAGSPLTSLTGTLHTSWANVSILSAENASFGAHGGSHLSSIGGTIRLGELLPGAPPIRHALKLMLFAAHYYWPGNATIPCFRWPALNCDGGRRGSRNPKDPNFYNGTDPALRPGSLLAVPPAAAKEILPSLATAVGDKLLAALTDYGGYLDDNTAGSAGAFNVEDGVEDEVAAVYGGQTLRPSGPPDPLYADLLAIYRALHVVANNGPTSVGGGGRPRRPRAPPIC